MADRGATKAVAERCCDRAKLSRPDVQLCSRLMGAGYLPLQRRVKQRRKKFKKICTDDSPLRQEDVHSRMCFCLKVQKRCSGEVGHATCSVLSCSRSTSHITWAGWMGVIPNLRKNNLSELLGLFIHKCCESYRSHRDYDHGIYEISARMYRHRVLKHRFT
jgi:hypothetical protein